MTALSPRLAAEIARSLGAADSLAALIPALFAGAPSLGAPTRRAATILAPHLTPRSRFLDLGCGTGALAIEVARRTRCRTAGVDGCPEFIDRARERAERLKLSRFTWNLADIRHWRGAVGGFDAAAMLNLFPAAEAARFVRRFVRPGGVYLVDDAVRDPRHRRGSAHGPFAGVPDAAEVSGAIVSLGDTILRRVMLPAPAVRAMAARSLSDLRRAVGDLRAARLSIRQRRGLETLLKHHAAAARDLTGPLRPTLWLVRRSS